MTRIVFICFALILSGFLGACGFTPMHGSAGAAAPLTNMNVQVKKGSDIVDNQAGFFVAQRLRDRIGTSSANAPYTLKIIPRYTRRRLGLTVGDVASRYDIIVTASWELLDSKTGNRVNKGFARSTVTFGAPEGPYGVITADNVGIEQGAKETADKLIVQIASHFAEENKKSKK